MKKTALPLLCLLCLFGCAEAKPAAPFATSAAHSPAAPAVPLTGGYIDLTALDSDTVFYEVSNMMANPAGYLGKTVRMSGSYSPVYFAETGSYYHYVVITDALGCCPQGLEFLWEGVYPEDYPSENAQVEVFGVFGTYTELRVPYYCEEAAECTVL